MITRGCAPRSASRRAFPPRCSSTRRAKTCTGVLTEVWTARAAFDAFFADRLRPVLAERRAEAVVTGQAALDGLVVSPAVHLDALNRIAGAIHGAVVEQTTDLTVGPGRAPASHLARLVGMGLISEGESAQLSELIETVLGQRPRREPAEMLSMSRALRDAAGPVATAIAAVAEDSLTRFSARLPKEEALSLTTGSVVGDDIVGAVIGGVSGGVAGEMVGGPAGAAFGAGFGAVLVGATASAQAAG